MKFRSSALFLLAPFLALMILIGSLQAYVPIRWGAAGIRLSYPPNRFPLVFHLNNGTAQGSGNVASGSDVLGAVKASLEAWQSIQTAAVRFADLQFTSQEAARSNDGINLITMADTPENTQLLGENTLALTRLIFSPNSGNISESDIIFNPRMAFSTNLAPNTFDVQSVMTHELGHALGCDHATAASDTMFFASGEGEFFQRFLSADALAFASFTYPNLTRIDSLGIITGRVTMNGSGIFGASVAAINLDRNLIYTALSEPDGGYALTGPIAGRYAFFAEPLDGPVTTNQLLGSGGDAFYRDLNTNFRTAARVGQSLLNAPAVNLTATRAEISFAVPSGTATLNISRMGRNDPNTGTLFLGGGPAVVFPGEDLTLTVGGPETWNAASLDNIGILGTGITIDRSREPRVIQSDSGTNLGISLRIRVTPDAAPGPRTLVMRVGDQEVAGTGGIVVGMRALPLRTLYLPYLFTSPEVYTGVALANPTETPAAARISSRDNQGNLIYDTNALVPADLSIPRRAQIARVERQLFNLPFDTRQSGSLTVESDSPALQGFFLAGDLRSTFLDGAEAFTRAYKQLYFVDILQNPNTATEIHLMNVTDSAVSVQLSLIGTFGQPLGSTVTRAIPARGKVGESVAALFGVNQPIASAHVRAVAAEEALAGFALIRQSSAVFGINALPAENAAALLYSPQLAVGSLGLNFSTRLNVVNVGDSPAAVALTVLSDDGQVVPAPANPAPVPIPAGGHLSLDALSYFGFTQPIQGSVRVSASGGARLLGNVLFGDGDPTRNRLGFGAALPLYSSGLTSFVFSQVAQAQGFFTGLAFFAPEGANLTVDVFREDGSPNGSQSLSLVSGGRLVRLLYELIPATRGQVRGHVRITSNRRVYAFELFGATDGQFLSAVPPQPLGSN